MALSGIWDAIQGRLSFLVNDKDIADAANNCYADICHNRGFTPARCPLKLEHIGHIIWSYIHYFTTHPDQDARYYYDEYEDRSDPYRRKMVERIGQMVGQSYGFTNEVLRELYWGVKRGVVAPGILRPREVKRFQNEDFWYGGVFGGLFKISVELVNFANAILLKLGHIVSQVSQAVQDTLDGVGNLLGATGRTLKYLPWILGAAAVGFLGFQAYTFKKKGEFFSIKN